MSRASEEVPPILVGTTIHASNGRILLARVKIAVLNKLDNRSGARMSARITHRNLPLMLLRAREILLSHFRPILNHYGLTEQQWRIMRVLSEQGDLEPWQICDQCQILSPSLTGVLTRMEEVALVQRSRVPEDARRVLVRLTPQAEQLVTEIAPLVEAQYQLLETAIGPTLINQLYATLDQVARAENALVERVKLPATRYTSPSNARVTRKTASRTRSAQSKINDS